jgi:diguanylate cyclase (GGDEF)-like protein
MLPSLAESLPWITPATAFGLALLFRRPRTALLAYDLALTLLWPHPPSPGLLPLLALVALLVPEARITGLRAVALALLPWLLGWGERTWLPAFLVSGVAVLLSAHLAWLLALGQWVRDGDPLRLAQAAALALAALTIAPIGAAPPWAASVAAALAAALLLVGLVLASYRMAFQDPLTGLRNRRALEETLGRIAAPCAVAMVDVDHFKRINDRYGHPGGDRVLVAIARALRRVPRALAFRYGGEEFCLVFSGRFAAGAEASLEALRRRIARERVAVAGRSASREVKVTVSIGLAATERGPCDGFALRAKADAALYRAKEAGRNRVVRA